MKRAAAEKEYRDIMEMDQSNATGDPANRDKAKRAAAVRAREAAEAEAEDSTPNLSSSSSSDPLRPQRAAGPRVSVRVRRGKVGGGREDVKTYGRGGKGKRFSKLGLGERDSQQVDADLDHIGSDAHREAHTGDAEEGRLVEAHALDELDTIKQEIE